MVNLLKFLRCALARRLFPAILCLVLPSQIEPQKQLPPAFRAGTVMVRVDVVVVDRAGQPVSGLEKSDFRMLEEGERQDIAQFVAVDSAMQPATRDTSIDWRPAAVTSNAIHDQARLVVIVLDDLNTLQGREERVKTTAGRVLARLSPDDLVAVVYTSGRPDGARDFTRSPGSLMSAVELFEGRKSRFSRTDTILPPPGVTARVSERITGRAGGREAENELPDVSLAKGFAQLTALQTLTQTASRLAEPDRRKILIYLGEGVDADLAHPRPADPMHWTFEDACNDEARDFVSAAQRANVAFYAVDPRGPTRFGEEGLIGNPAPEQLLVFADRARVGREGLQFLAVETGGIAVTDVGDYQAAADRIVGELGRYYVIGYYPRETGQAGRFRRISVEVSRPGVHVRARKGYFPLPRTREKAGNDVTSKLGKALSSLLPSADLSMHLTAACFRSASKDRSTIVVSASVEYPFSPGSDPNGRLDDRIEFEAIVVSLEGKVRARDRRTLKGLLVPTNAPRTDGPLPMPVARAHLVTRLEAPPGRYSLRVAAHSQRLERAGSVFLDLDVRDFTGRLSLSDLVISHEGPGIMTPPPARVRSFMPIFPSTVRRFDAAGHLHGFLRAYRGARSSGKAVELTAFLVDENGSEMFRTSERQHDLTLALGSGLPFDVRIPLNSLPAAAYRLVIEAREEGLSSVVIQRQAVFEVRR